MVRKDMPRAAFFGVRGDWLREPEECARELVAVKYNRRLSHWAELSCRKEEVKIIITDELNIRERRGRMAESLVRSSEKRECRENTLVEV